ncbi:MAG: hypothetical protein CSA15_03230 [Candidatus Delongbacteria bacterium]|nr:MAG: hypothetical protein CSA15_03230 [Candidatus Delongbacteria bacterium]
MFVKIPTIRQRDMSECGTTCLSIIFRYYGFYNIQSILRDLANVSSEGTNLLVLRNIAQQFGFDSDGFKIEYNFFKKIHLPCIAHYEGNHFVVVYKVTNKYIWLIDPSYGKTRLSKYDFQKKWKGVILQIKATNSIFKNEKLMNRVEKEIKNRKLIIKKFYFSILYSFKKNIFIILFLTFVIQLLALALPYYSKELLDKVIIAKNKEILHSILIILLIILISRLLITLLRNILLTKFKKHFELKFFSTFFNHLMSLKQSYFDSHKREDFINRFQENLKIRSIFSPGIIQSILDVVFIVFYLISLYLISISLANIVLGVVLLFSLITIYFSPKLRHLENKVFQENLKSMGSFLDSLLGIRTIKFLTLEEKKIEEWKKDYSSNLSNVYKSEKYSILIQFLINAIFVSSQIFIYWLGAYFIFFQKITIGDYIAFTMIFSMIINPLKNISRIWFMITELSITFDKLNDIFIQKEEEISTNENNLSFKNKDIKINNLSFSYNPNKNKNILTDINIKIPYGKKISIVGRNGSGKTSFVNLLTALYSNYNGSIFIGNDNFKNIQLRNIRSNIAIIPQEVYIFNGTIRENILCSNPNASEKDLLKAIKLADLEYYLTNNYFGLDYKIGSSGSELSGGQKLKIAFARLFLMKPDIIILDEATSVLDIESENIIMNNLNNYFKNITIISIAHRLNTVKNSDIIFVFNEGKIVEEGSHEELLAIKGEYFNFMKTYLDF